jgi:REP element-mobilizing transposase RayT
MYHVCARGHNREALFGEDADRKEFLEMLSDMREQYRVQVLAYCLMDNHYHLLIKTPDGNISRAIQWLNGRYGIWQGRKYQRVGHLFAGRFKSVLVEAESWGLEVSRYIHMNPVSTEEMGLGKKAKALQRQGWAGAPSPEEVARRLEKVREYRWSSYRAYAGYERAPKWLDSGVLLKRMDGTAVYREKMEEQIRQGVEESFGAKVKWGVVLGGERFARKVRGVIRIDRESSGRQELRRRLSFEEIVKKVEQMAGCPWMEFRDRHGDVWRDVVLWSARRHGGLTLEEIGERAGEVDYSAVSVAIKRLELRATKDRALRKVMKELNQLC